jgi:hypothetical protein
MGTGMESTGIGIDVRVELTHRGMCSTNLLEKLECLGPSEHGDRHGEYGHRDRGMGSTQA